MSTTFAFVTKSYAPDLERCELLCRSIELLAPEARHWLIVDARDRGAFQSLERGTTQLVTTEELLPRRVRKLELYGIKNVWFGTRMPPIRGWLVQQLAKLAISLLAREDVLIHADSDVALIRRFHARSLRGKDGSLPLFQVPAAIDEGLPDHLSWHRTAERLLGLPARPLPLPDYIGGLVPWRRDSAVELLERIATRSGRDWMATLARERHLSEYILYGRFVDDVLSRPGAADAESFSLCHCYWGSEPLTNKELESFIDDAAPSEVGVMVSAKAGMHPRDYAPVLERRWAAVSGSSEDDAASPLPRSDS